MLTARTTRRGAAGRSPHGERGLKFLLSLAHNARNTCRSPHGERGLKYASKYGYAETYLSLPTWGAWIEMPSRGNQLHYPPSRSPHGERGLKYSGRGHYPLTLKSLPTWGAWIEMVLSTLRAGTWKRRSPHGERGLK